MNLQLKKLFDKYNKKYFKNKLKISDIRFGKSLGLGQTDYNKQFPSITIIPQLKKSNRILKIVLLHEMIHVLGIDNHGPKFIRRVHRLVRQGAYDDLL